MAQHHGTTQGGLVPDRKPVVLFAAALLSCAAVAVYARAKAPASSLKPFAVSFRGVEKETALLGGPPQTRGYRSGLVVLQKGQDMHEHTTGRHEEALVILAGEGKALFPGREDIGFQEGTLLYIPPETRHSVLNTGTGPLKYIYLVAPVTKEGA
jgi:quercetin dioxygenase-like cupin family protein